MMNKFSASESRYAAYEHFKDKAEKALKDGNAEDFNKYIGLFLERLSIAADNSIKDAEEKQFIKDFLKQLGSNVVGPLKDFIKEKYAVAHPIEVLIHIEGREQCLDFLDAVLNTDDTLFDDPLVEKRIEILKHFAGDTHASVLKKAQVFLNDSDDRLVIASIRFIRDYAFKDEKEFEAVRDRLVEKFMDPETSARIRMEILNVFVEQEWKVSKSETFEALLPEGYHVNAQGYLKIIKQKYEG
jgi:hypothetical protein